MHSDLQSVFQVRVRVCQLAGAKVARPWSGESFALRPVCGNARRLCRLRVPYSRSFHTHRDMRRRGEPPPLVCRHCVVAYECPKCVAENEAEAWELTVRWALRSGFKLNHARCRHRLQAAHCEVCREKCIDAALACRDATSTLGKVLARRRADVEEAPADGIVNAQPAGERAQAVRCFSPCAFAAACQVRRPQRSPVKQRIQMWTIRRCSGIIGRNIFSALHVPSGVAPTQGIAFALIRQRAGLLGTRQLRLG